MGPADDGDHSGISDLGFRFLYVGRADVKWDDSFGLGPAYMYARHHSPARPVPAAPFKPNRN